MVEFEIAAEKFEQTPMPFLQGTLNPNIAQLPQRP